LAFAYFAGLYFSANLLTPVNRVVKEVNQITEDNLGYRLKLTNDTAASADEIDELIITFNALLTRIESAFVALKRFVQNASHELKTPLTAIMAEAELALARDRSNAEYKRTLEVVTQETERLVTITQGLLALAQLEEGGYQTEMESVNVNTLLNNTLAAFKLHHPAREVEEHGVQGSFYVHGNSQLLQIALLNMLDNSAKYSTDKILVRWTVKETNIKIEIEDFGIGIPAGELDRLFFPMFRGSNVRNVSGAGLGLPLVNRIISVHSGQLKISSEVGKGTCCEVILPLI
jgi:signal transduction histidine kinase